MTGRYGSGRSAPSGFPWRRLDITGSSLGFVNRAATPEYRLGLTGTNLTVENLSNQGRDGPATIRLKDRLMGTGDTAVTMKVNATNRRRRRRSHRPDR
jgi:hypothetical protein